MNDIIGCVCGEREYEGATQARVIFTYPVVSVSSITTDFSRGARSLLVKSEGKR